METQHTGITIPQIQAAKFDFKLVCNDIDLDYDGIPDHEDNCTDTDGDNLGNPGFPLFASFDGIGPARTRVLVLS